MMMAPLLAGAWRARLVLLVGLLVAAAVAPSFLRGWPNDQAVRYRLGDAAANVRELDARWRSGDGSEDWTRTVSFRYAPGKAPRVVTDEPRIPDGDYTVQIEVVAEDSRKVVERRVTVGAGVTYIELADALAYRGDDPERVSR